MTSPFTDEQLEAMAEGAPPPCDPSDYSEVIMRLAKDARRYEYLRAAPPWKSRVSIVNVADTPDDTALLCGADLDAAIDAAIGSGK